MRFVSKLIRLRTMLDGCAKYILIGAAALVPLNTAHGSTVLLLHAFTGGGDGASPFDGLIKDSTGNLYGTTNSGGGGTGCVHGCGTVFKLSADGTETVLYAFAGGNDGDYPVAGLIKDKAGNLYGTTAGVGPDDCGTVFRLAPDGTEKVLHVFRVKGNKGKHPYGSLIEDAAGNIYGTTTAGGSDYYGYGTVFELDNQS